jgi:hypothetical protein
MIWLQYGRINLTLSVLVFATLIYTTLVSIAFGNVGFYTKNESPLGISQGDWLGKYWNWDWSISTDPETNTFSGLHDGGCLVHKENSTVMLLDPAAGGVWNQKCTISSNEAIVIPLWIGECNQGAKGYEKASYKQLSDCARNFDLGKIKGFVKVDNNPVANLDAVDYTTKIMNNVSEVYTKQFNETVPKGTHLVTEQFGTFPAAAHGWLVFLKPLSPGNHTVYYQNNVAPTTLSGAGNVNTAQITYDFNVK